VAGAVAVGRIGMDLLVHQWRLIW